jgi:uncharacterized LabA/DUF88 family protein
MTQQLDDRSAVHSALFVDFDNIYGSFAAQDKYIATQFATNPEQWLTWLDQKMPFEHLHTGASYRRILVRRCYLNPQAFAAYRPYFIRAAFEVIDCPPLTTRGKTSTDIHMVMDILDALNHCTHFQEFIILSGDSDFTPVLLRLRKHDRYSVVLSAGYVSPAYKSSCDHMISQEAFVKDALGISEQEEDVIVPIRDEELRDLAGLLKRMAARLYEAAIVPSGIEASDLPAIYKEFQEFRVGEHWLGFFSLRRLTEAIVSQNGDLIIVEKDPWRVARADRVRDIAEMDIVPSVPKKPTTEMTHENLKGAISEWIKKLVETSKAAVPMAALAQAISTRFGQHLSNSDWLGAGSFKGLLQDLDLGDLEIWAATPGFVYDPQRHPIQATAPEKEEEGYTPSRGPLDPFSLRYPDLAPLVQKIHQLTDTPYLMPEHYALLLQELAREINESGYQMTRTSKTVRDRCVERGAPIARSHVNFVLTGIGYTGHRFGQSLPERADVLGEALVQNTINLCRRAQVDVDQDEMAQIRKWIIGAVAC